MLVVKALGSAWCEIGLRRAVAFVGVLFLAGALRANQAKPAHEAFDIWQPEEDTGQQTPITAIVQSTQGYLWLGTYHGLVRFDGVRSTVFDAGNTPGLQNAIITSLFETPDGVLWIGHETGQLTRLVNGVFEPVKLGRNWPGGNVEAITADEQGALWLLNDAGILFRLSDGTTASIPGGASPTRKAALSRSISGKPWIVCGGEVSTLQQSSVLPYRISGAAAGDYFERVMPARDGGLWVLGNQRLRKWKNEHWTEELEGCPRMPGSVSVLLESRTGLILAGTLRDGLYAFASGGETFHFSRTNGLSHDWVRSLCEDREGNIWVGTAAGLDGLRPRKVQMLIAPDEFQGCKVLSLSVPAPDSAWIGTEGAGLYHYQNGVWTSFSQASGMSNLFVWSVFETQQKELLVGTWGGGILRKSADNFEMVSDLSQITAPVTSLYQSRHGDLWIGTTTGLYQYQRGKLVWFAGKERIAFPDVRAITENADGTIWIGMSGGGLASIRDDTIRQFRKQDGVGSDFVICLYGDSDGTLWVGTSDNGLTRLKDGTFANLGSKQGLPNSVICQIVDDGRGNLWIGSHAGLLRARKDDLNRCANGLLSKVYWLSYGKADGLTSQTCSGGFQPNAVHGVDGRIWFPTVKGVAVVDPDNIATDNNRVPPVVVIEELLVDGEPIDLRSGKKSANSYAGGSVVQVPPGKQKFELRYTGLSFIAPHKVRFKHRLAELEDDWTAASTERLAEYSYLRPGSYHFQVIACNNDGLWNEQGAALAFTVLPFFWQTVWFKSACGSSLAAALGAGIFWASRRRVRLKLEQSERQHALERERARIARDIHDDLGASLTRITMLSQSVRSELEERAQTTADVDQIYSTARELTRAMDEIVWAVNPKHDTLDSLVTYLGRFAQHYLSSAGVRCRLDVPVYLPGWALTSEIRHNVFLALKEALHNVVKHARATEVRISLTVEPCGFVITLIDNGCGFDPQARPVLAGQGSENARISSGNGLSNMSRRLEEIGGQCEWKTAPGEGTRVRFVIKTHDI